MAAAMPIRSLLKLVMMTLKPSFSAPMRFATGTRTSSKYSVAVSEAHHPIFRSSGVREKPSASVGIRSIETPAAPGPPVRTAVDTQLARIPPVIYVLLPLIT